MAGKPKRSVLPRSEVDIEVDKIGHSIRKLITIAAEYESEILASEAAQALLELGALPGYPISTIIELIPDPIRRRVLINLLREIPPAAEIASSLTLMRIAANDPSEEVRSAAAEALRIRRERALERFSRLAELRNVQARLQDEACAAKGRQAESGSPGQP